MIGRNSTGAPRFSKDQILYQIDTKDKELNIPSAFAIVERSIFREDLVMIDRILDSEHVLKIYKENKHHEEYYDRIISTINTNVISYDIFIKCYMISPSRFLEKLSIDVHKYLMFRNDRDKFISFFSENNVDVRRPDAEEIIRSPIFQNIKYANYLSTWNSFTKYIKNPEHYWDSYHYIIEEAKKMEHVMKLILRRKKVETLLEKSK